MAYREDVLKPDRFTEKERRNLSILDIIRRAREASKTEISKITHLNIVTISNYVDDYIKKGLVIEKGLDVSTGGRRPELLEINAKYGYAVGIDMGSPHIIEDTNIVGVVIDACGKTVAKVKEKKVQEAPEKLIAKVVNLTGDLISKSKISKDNMKGIGVGLWGVLDRYGGTTRYAVEEGGVLSYLSLQSALDKNFGIQSLVEHDAIAGVLSERWMGLGLKAEAENIIYICSDSSCGLILNGEIYYGTSKSAGELNLNPPKTGASDGNCWATYDHGCGFRSRGIDLGVQARAKALLTAKKDAKSRILELAGGDIDKISFQAVIEAAKSGDKVARDLLVEAGDYLGTKIAFLINLFNPDTIVIGRGVERAGDIFMEAVKAGIKKWAYEESLRVARIIPTSLGEDSVACGAAALVMQQVFARI